VRAPAVYVTERTLRVTEHGLREYAVEAVIDKHDPPGVVQRVAISAIDSTVLVFMMHFAFPGWRASTPAPPHVLVLSIDGRAGQAYGV